MSNEELQPARTRGVRWRQLRVGDPIGRPLGEWAYITPGHPDGITGSSLRLADEATQLETARFWFFLNYAPYQLPPGTYFGFASEPINEAGVAQAFAPDLDMSFGGDPTSLNALSAGNGFGSGAVYPGAFGSPFAPSPLRAGELLHHQFGDALSEEVHSKLAEELGNDWIERDRLESTPTLEDVTDSSLVDVQAEVLATLEAIREQVAAIPDPPIGMGHNGPPDEPPMVTIDRETFFELVHRAKVGVASGDARGASEFAEAAHSLKDLSRKFAGSALKLAGVFTTKAAESAGTETGKWVVRAIAASGTLMLLIEQLAKHADQIAKLVN